ncbi:MAG TPA: shikimate dehydrogenase [Burkholderiaceae bacterium]|nr:shikimate dehydrogenase [Burkholderiaceae bacterium]
MNTPDRYAVIGNPVEHSKSPEIHTYFAVQAGQNIVYERLLAPLDGFVDSVQSFVRDGGRGVNVTVPFKLQAHAFATVLTERAQAAGAVNTLKFDGDIILGDNTDGVGLVVDIIRNAGRVLTGKRILLIGAGGAARGVVLPLLEQAPAELVVINRTISKAVELAYRFADKGCIVAGDAKALQRSFDIIINATSSSLVEEMPPLDSAVFAESSLAYDMMYAKEPTVFLRFASERGATIRDGLGMLVEQAAESFFVWRGVRVNTMPILASLRGKM